MKGIECAFVASLGQDVELKTSKAGKRFASFSCIVDMGQDEDGQWLRVICFGDTAEKLAECSYKGDRIYVEGSITLNSWQNSEGETKHGLNVTAWRAERLANIGRAKVKRETDEDEAPSGRGNLVRLAKAAKTLKDKEDKAKAKSHAWPFNDELSF